MAVTKVGHRERLIEGMTQVAARHGYAGASVARVIEQAGVSRATFYEHFADKEACFLASFQVAADRIEVGLKRINDDCPVAERASELLDDLLVNIAANPAAARVLLVEALAAGAEVRQAHERLSTTVETTLEGWLCNAAHGFRLAISGRAILEGTNGILQTRTFRGETALLADLRHDLLAWINSHVVAAERPRLDPEGWRRLGAALADTPWRPSPGIARRLPRGRNAAAREVVAGEHRERILAAVALLARTKGYTAMTVADIVSTGSVTREAFYEIFKSKEDAFLATQSAGLEKSISVTAASFFAGENWPIRVWDGLEALLGFIALQPDLVYLDVIESFAVGAASLHRSFDNKMAYTLFLEDGYRQRPEAERLPRLCSEAIGGAILGLLRWQVGEGKTEQMLEVLPQAAYLALAPFIGPPAAMEFVETKVAEAGAAAI